jgi:hypothetical protein
MDDTLPSMERPMNIFTEDMMLEAARKSNEDQRKVMRMALIDTLIERDDILYSLEFIIRRTAEALHAATKVEKKGWKKNGHRTRDPYFDGFDAALAEVEKKWDDVMGKP